MKKLIAVILILVILLPAAVLAEERDPIVGIWYLCVDVTLYPELSGAYNGKDLLFDIYNFMPDGPVMAAGLEQTGQKGETSFQPTGRWEKEEDHYLLKVLNYGNTIIYVKGDLLYLKLTTADGSDSYLIMHRAIPMDPYSDITSTVD